MFKVLVLILAVAAAAQAGLVPVRRNQPAPLCKCRAQKSPVIYYPGEVNAALAQATSHPLQNPVKTKGKSKLDKPREYPHKFGNKEKLHFPHCSGATTYYEFPILQGGGLYTPGTNPSKHNMPPDADRIVYDQNHNFCGCMSHIDHNGHPVPHSGFVICPA